MGPDVRQRVKLGGLFALRNRRPRIDSLERGRLLIVKPSVVSHLVIFRNRKLVPQDQYHLVLGDGDELLLFPAIAGG